MKIGHASIDEHNTSHGGAAGDQTGKEVCTREWYDKSWDLLLRPLDQNKAEKMAQTCELVCLNPNIGYDQYQRNSLRTQAIRNNWRVELIDIPCECDCSSFMTVCAESADIDIPYNAGNAPTTSTMKTAFMSTGKFECLTDKKYLKGTEYLKRGDILVKQGSHTVMVLENGGSSYNNEPATTIKYTDKTFLAKLKPYVLKDMDDFGILASLTAAQAFIESNKGNSGLTTKANNLFGIKGTYQGQSVKMLTTEYYNGVPQEVYADFRKYPSWQESIADHSALFNRLNRYSNLRGLTDYKLACKYVQQDGYATSPSYANTLLSTINKYKLYEWDNEVLGNLTPSVQPLPVYDTPLLRVGSTGEYVLAWQKFLNLNGYHCGTEDGIFGSNTQIAVKNWQKAHGLTADGIIGPKTWASINL